MAVYISKIAISSLFFLQTFWWDSTPSILRMQYTSSSTEWTSFIIRKQIHFLWSNTASCFFRFSHVDQELLHLLLIFSIYIYNSRRSESLKIKSLIWVITKVKNIEEKVSLNNEKRHAIYKRKWQLVENVFKTEPCWHFIWLSL